MEKELIKRFGLDKIKIDEPMSEHTNMKIGGPADYFMEANKEEELIKIISLAQEIKIPYTILGLGANVLVSDRGVRGLVVINKVKKLKFLPHGFIEVGSGMDNTTLIREAGNRGLLGMERLMKVPGTVGGAVYMNAGDTGKQEFFGDLVEAVRILDDKGKIKNIYKKDAGFAYRSSRFQTSGEIILSVKIHLKRATQKEIEERKKDILLRKSDHPAGATIGSTFKNPKDMHAGELIEKARLKGKEIGGAKISEKHANFIINEDDASAADVKQLINLMKSSVKEKFNVDLEEEVRYIGDW